MTDDIENLLKRFHPTAPPATLREKILAPHLPAPNLHPNSPLPRWPLYLYLYRSALAASLLLSFSLIHTANQLNQNSASQVGIGPPRWTPEAQAAADLLDPNGGKEARQYIALRLMSDYARPASPLPAQGVLQ